MFKKYAVIVATAMGLSFGYTAAALAQSIGGLSIPSVVPPPSSASLTAPLPPPPNMPSPPAPAVSGPIQLQSVPVAPQVAPNATVPTTSVDQFEHHDSVQAIPSIFVHQWTLENPVPPESIISQSYMRTAETTARRMTLKEVIYIALRNNPLIKSIELTPVASQESVAEANGAFDPSLTAQVDEEKTVTPSTSPTLTSGSNTSVSKLYDWDFGLNKASALTNGTMGITFNNERSASNSVFASINPSYVPSLTMSLSQPLLQNFGWRFATLDVDIAESNQKSSQWNYAQSLMDQIQRIAGDYWNVVLGEENLAVARSALKFNVDLVHVNAISLRVGTLAPLSLQEAQSAAATAEANVYTAEANLKTARAQLRQDVMYNPDNTFLPAEIEPSQLPNPHQTIDIDENHSLELAAEYLPSLAALREGIRASLMQVRYQENQVLPQLNIGAQFGLTSTAGTSRCNTPLGTPTAGAGNCTPPPSSTSGPYPALSGDRLPFGGIYGDALNRLWSFSYYNYAAVISFQMPLDDAVSRAALAQARVLYEQQRMNYRAALSTAVAGIENAVANLYADQKRALATEQATYYAQESLRDEQVEFRVGMATTHDLLQYQEEEVSAEGNQVQAFVDLENAKINLGHAQGTLLNAFNVDFRLANPHTTPWYTLF